LCECDVVGLELSSELELETVAGPLGAAGNPGACGRVCVRGVGVLVGLPRSPQLEIKSCYV